MALGTRGSAAAAGRRAAAANFTAVVRRGGGEERRGGAGALARHRPLAALSLSSHGGRWRAFGPLAGGAGLRAVAAAGPAAVWAAGDNPALLRYNGSGWKDRSAAAAAAVAAAVAAAAGRTALGSGAALLAVTAQGAGPA